VITGLVNKAQRDKRLSDFSSGRTPIMIGTVFGEGVDIPEIDVVIVASGGQDEKQTMQNLRNLTPSPGKTEAIVIDFMDMSNKYFANHARSRLKVYRSEPEFRIKIKD
jgi:superfamily II DNA or RNA helicase